MRAWRLHRQLGLRRQRWRLQPQQSLGPRQCRRLGPRRRQCQPLGPRRPLGRRRLGRLRLGRLLPRAVLHFGGSLPLLVQAPAGVQGSRAPQRARPLEPPRLVLRGQWPLTVAAVPFLVHQARPQLLLAARGARLVQEELLSRPRSWLSATRRQYADRCHRIRPMRYYRVLGSQDLHGRSASAWSIQELA